MKTGVWLDRLDTIGGECSECGKICSEITIVPGGLTENNWEYCPCCGAKMFDKAKALNAGETETWHSRKSNIEMPKGLFDAIWEDDEE